MTVTSPPRPRGAGAGVRVPPRRLPPARRSPTPPRRAARPESSRRPGGAPGDGRWRLIVVAVVVCLAFAGLAARLVDVQVLSSDRYAGMGRDQRFDTIPLAARRGAIFDRNGAELAVSVDRVAVWANPKLVLDPLRTAQALAGPLGTEEDRLAERLAGPGSFVYLARQVEESVATEIRALGLKGIGFEDDTARVDPAGDLALSVLGRVGTENLGLSGIEKQYEQLLAGTPGSLMLERGPQGADIAGGERRRDAPVPGADLHLTLDRDLQWAVEEALAGQIRSANAKGGMALVMDPLTGEILAMASLETGAGGSVRVASYNKALVDVYEPGSVTKIVTMAAALEEGAVSREERFNVPDRLRVADSSFSDVAAHANGWWTPADIMAESSNVGTILVGQRLGAEQLDRYLRSFGFGAATGLGFPGESAGLVPSLSRWSGTSLATLSIGQGLAVNAVQVLSAYNAIANGGEYVAPQLVRRVVDGTGAEVTVDPPERRRVVSEATAAAVGDMLAGAVARGTGRAAAVEAYGVAGKTGTARKAIEGIAGYKDGAYMASFAGFLPAGAPRLSAMVVLDEPTPYTGSMAAAPVFAEIARFAVRHLGVPPNPSPGWALPGSGAVGPTATLGPSATRP